MPPLIRPVHWRLLGWLLFYAGAVPLLLPFCLDLLNRPSNWAVAAGLLGLGGLLVGAAASLFQAGRALLRRRPR
jgi:hypothetical protein